METTLTINELNDLVINVIFYFSICSLGAFFKVLYEAIQIENYKIRIGKVIVGGGTAAIICIGLNYSLLHQYNIGLRFMLGAILGVLGFELFEKIKTIEELKRLLNDVNDIRRGLNGEKIELRESDNSDEKNNTSP